MSEIYDALYTEQIIDYAGNPLIEALPPTQSYENVTRLLSVYPEFDKEERNASNEIRFEYIQRIFDYMQPLPPHFALEKKISSVIKQGYMNKNPLDKESVEYMNNSYKLLMDKKIPKINTKNTTKRVQGFSIIGISGVGKTTAIDRILQIYPQAIRHTNYKGRKLLLTQIPWLKLECPPDGSTKGLCISFFRELDNILNTKYSIRFERSTQDTMLSQMAHLSRLYNVGVLIVDEIQHLSLQKSGGADKMLNFFVSLVNAIGVPIILIGTNKAFDLLNKEFRQARRVIGQGSSIWKRLNNDIEWQLLMSGLFDYQWTREPVVYDEEINDVMYSESQGIIDIAKKLFILTQIEAIVQKKEKITSELIKWTANKHFKSLKEMLEAIRSDDPKKLNKYQDLKVDIYSTIENLEESMQEDEFFQHRKEINKQIELEVKKTLKKKLMGKIQDKKSIDKAVNQLLSKLNVSTYNIDDLYQKALQIAEANIENSIKKKVPKINIEELETNDLRRVKENALKNKQSVYSTFRKVNLIRNLYSDLNLRQGG